MTKLALVLWMVIASQSLFGQGSSPLEKIDSLHVLLQSSSHKDLVDIYNEISWNYRNIHIDSTIYYADKAYELSTSLNYPLGLSKSLNFKGVAYRNQSNFLKALSCFFDALKHAEQSRNLVQISYTLINIGNIYVFQTNYEGAIDYFEKALINANKLEDIDLIAYCHVNLGRSYVGLKNYIDGEKHLKHALELRIEQKNDEGITITRVDLANLYILDGKYDRAESLLLQNLKDVKSLSHQTTLAYSYLNLAKISLYKNDLDKAKKYAKQSLSVCEANRIKKIESDILNLLSSIYEEDGNTAQSLYYLQQFIIQKDSIFNEESTRKIESLHASYAAEKKEAETKFLKQQTELNLLVIHRQKIIIWLAVIISILFLGLAITALKAAKDRKKMTFQIEKQKEDAFKHNNSLIDLNHEKNNLIRILSHDLRAPINNVKGLTMVHMSNHNFDKEDRDMLDHIVTESDRLLNMITKILNVEALEEETKNYRSDKINVAFVAEQVIDNYRSAGKQKNIQFTYDLGKKARHILGDQLQLHQTMENLMSNAIKFSPKNTTIHVQITSFENDKKLRISFKDQGPGLTDEDKSKIFKKFQTLSAKPTGDEQSTGLGLSIAKQYVEQMEGAIWVESTYGEGTTFHIEFAQVQ